MYRTPTLAQRRSSGSQSQRAEAPSAHLLRSDGRALQQAQMRGAMAPNRLGHANKACSTRQGLSSLPNCTFLAPNRSFTASELRHASTCHAPLTHRALSLCHTLVNLAHDSSIRPNKLPPCGPSTPHLLLQLTKARLFNADAWHFFSITGNCISLHCSYLAPACIPEAAAFFHCSVATVLLSLTPCTCKSM